MKHGQPQNRHQAIDRWLKSSVAPCPPCEPLSLQPRDASLQVDRTRNNVLPVDPARDKGRCQHADGSDERRFGGIFSLRERRVNDGQAVVRFGVSDAG